MASVGAQGRKDFQDLHKASFRLPEVLYDPINLLKRVHIGDYIVEYVGV